VIHAQPAGDGIRVRTALARVRPPVVWPQREVVAGEERSNKPRGRRWVSHVARGFRTGAGGIRQIEPRREQAAPDRYILEITAPENLESTMQERQTVDQEIASSSRQPADPPSPPSARQTEPAMLINPGDERH